MRFLIIHPGVYGTIMRHSLKIKHKVERSGDALMKTVIFCDIYGSLSGVNEVPPPPPWMCQECRRMVLPIYLGYNYPNAVFMDCWILKMEAKLFSETVVNIFQSIWILIYLLLHN